jgi:hypothetical protein
MRSEGVESFCGERLCHSVPFDPGSPKYPRRHPEIAGLKVSERPCNSGYDRLRVSPEGSWRD